MLTICKYLLQGLAHIIILFLEFIEYNSGVLYSIILLTILFRLPKVYKAILDLIRCCGNLLRFSVVNLFIGTTLFINILIVFVFDDEISLLFILLFFIGLISDLKDYLGHNSKMFTIKIIRTEMMRIMKSTTYLMLIRIVYMIDNWDFSKINKLYIYLIYGGITFTFVLVKKLYLILQDLYYRANYFECIDGFYEVLVLYMYSSIKHKSLIESEQHLLKYFSHTRYSKHHQMSSKRNLYRIYSKLSSYKNYLNRGKLIETI